MNSAQQKFSKKVQATALYLEAHAGKKFGVRSIANVFRCSEPAARRRLQAAYKSNPSIKATEGRVGLRGPFSEVFWFDEKGA